MHCLALCEKSAAVAPGSNIRTQPRPFGVREERATGRRGDGVGDGVKSNIRTRPLPFTEKGSAPSDGIELPGADPTKFWAARHTAGDKVKSNIRTRPLPFTEKDSAPLDGIEPQGAVHHAPSGAGTRRAYLAFGPGDGVTATGSSLIACFHCLTSRLGGTSAPQPRAPAYARARATATPTHITTASAAARPAPCRAGWPRCTGATPQCCRPRPPAARHPWPCGGPARPAFPTPAA